MTGTPIDPEEVNRLRVALGRLSRRLRGTPAGAGMTPTELSVLSTLFRDGPLRVSELAATEGVNPTMLSRVVGRLEGTGLLTRVVDPADRRAAVLDVTHQGRRQLERIRAERSGALARRLDRLPPEQVSALLRALPALEALAEALREPVAAPASHASAGRSGR